MLNELFEIELTILIKMDLALNKLEKLICHKTQPTNQPNQTKPINADANLKQKIFIFIIYSIRTVVFIFIVIFWKSQLIRPSAFFSVSSRTGEPTRNL